MTGDWDFKPSVERLIALHAGDDHDPGPPIAPAITSPRPIPPARDDVASVARFAAWRRALRGRV